VQTGASLHGGFGWSDSSLELAIDVDPAGIARITRLAAAPAPAARTTALPLLDVVLAGEGRAWSGPRYCESVAGQRMRYRSHDLREDGNGWSRLRIDLADPATGLAAEVHYRILEDRGALRCWVRLVNQGSDSVTVESVTSFLGAGLPGGDPDDPGDLGDLDILWAENDWLAESRWQRRRLRDALPDLDRRAHGADPRGCFGITGRGTWSTCGHLPMGAVVNRRTGRAWAWQVEHNGAWHWQVGECTDRRPADQTSATVGHGSGRDVGSGAYLALLGPTDSEHQWYVTLAPGEEFTTVPVAIVVGAEGVDDILGRLTTYRRAIRRPHADHRRLPVIFNDYMNTLMGDPTAERLLPLIDAAASVGAEYFCIDAGWYAEAAEDWWDTVGAWKPSMTRFPGGIAEVLGRIRAAGMVPGLWLEPEVVGVRSPIAAQLPDQAFFTRRGRRVVENGRYQLDLRHPAAVKHLDEAVDFAVGELGAGYLKLDYNIDAGPGTDAGGLSAGAGLLDHNRAHLDWLDAVLDRHPGLVIENCASGGMRADYAMLSRLQLQSTSDQQDLLRYAPIIAAAPAAMASEQAASWAYPQPDFSDEQIVFTLCGALLGRIHLSGHIDRMTDAQCRLVTDAVDVYKSVRADLPGALPFWPLGLPGWSDSWLALGMRVPTGAYLVVWHRDGGPAELTLPVDCLRGREIAVDVLYPRARGGGIEARWSADRGELAVSLPVTPAAGLIRLSTTPGSRRRVM
jgi:alpha-galactosidase